MKKFIFGIYILILALILVFISCGRNQTIEKLYTIKVIYLNESIDTLSIYSSSNNLTIVNGILCENNGYGNPSNSFANNIKSFEILSKQEIIKR
jgi:hypothetical protein